MPVSNTAAITPAPSKGDESAPTALTPQATVVEAFCSLDLHFDRFDKLHRNDRSYGKNIQIPSQHRNLVPVDLFDIDR